VYNIRTYRFLRIVCRIAFVDFDTVEAAQSAMKKMNKKNLDGRQMFIVYAETRDGGKLKIDVYMI